MCKISLVTGGSRGLGRNTALSIARHGSDVVLTCLKGSDNADEVVKEIEKLGRKAFAEMTALGRVGLPDDIGPIIASLLSEENRWDNAQRIEVSGGQAI
ncbi:SDR family NAD(P)-dependent oxidoreductase [Pelagibius marinus]|uniref:SDR family NAD(P)-dependent oxidoreductase n=1 Tax=Pelagibius marinus TaxID=2762760 RepID=UPI001872701C